MGNNAISPIKLDAGIYMSTAIDDDEGTWATGLLETYAHLHDWMVRVSGVESLSQEETTRLANDLFSYLVTLQKSIEVLLLIGVHGCEYDD